MNPIKVIGVIASPKGVAISSLLGLLRRFTPRNDKLFNASVIGLMILSVFVTTKRKEGDQHGGRKFYGRKGMSFWLKNKWVMFVSGRLLICRCVTVLFSILLSVAFSAEVLALEPCTCKHRKQIEKEIKDDEFLKQKYQEKAEEIQKRIDEAKALGRPYSGPIVIRHLDDYGIWVEQDLPKSFKEARGYTQVFNVHPDPKNLHKIDKAKLREYEKRAACRELYDAVIAHENHHIEVTKSLTEETLKKMTAADLAREEVQAYEKGLEKLRKALEKAEETCRYKCKFNQQVFETIGECQEVCEKVKPKGLHTATLGICYEKDPRTGEWKGRGF